MDISGSYKFECPQCGQHISATDELAGTQATCPACNTDLTVPGRQRVQGQSSAPPPRAGKARGANLALILAGLALLLSTVACIRVFLPRSAAKYSFKTPQDSINSLIELNQNGTWEDFRAQIYRNTGKKYSFEMLKKDAVELYKTVEVTSSGDKEKIGRVICFLRLKCPDGVTRFSTTAFEKNDLGEFVQSSYPGYINDEKMIPEDRRLIALIKKWETTGIFAEDQK